MKRPFLFMQANKKNDKPIMIDLEEIVCAEDKAGRTVSTLITLKNGGEYYVRESFIQVIAEINVDTIPVLPQ